MYRDPAAPQLPIALEARLSPHGFKTVEPDAALASRGVRKLWHRKTWNTNRGVILADLGAERVDAFVARMRHEAGVALGSSWFLQLGVQVIMLIDGAPVPTDFDLIPLVDMVNTQGVLVQSVFAVDLSTGRWAQARSPEQLVTGKFQNAIVEVLSEVAASALVR